MVRPLFSAFSQRFPYERENLPSTPPNTRNPEKNGQWGGPRLFRESLDSLMRFPLAFWVFLKSKDKETRDGAYKDSLTLSVNLSWALKASSCDVLWFPAMCPSKNAFFGRPARFPAGRGIFLQEGPFSVGKWIFLQEDPFFCKVCSERLRIMTGSVPLDDNQPTNITISKGANSTSVIGFEWS